MSSLEDRLSRLERLVETQQATIEAQAARIVSLETENVELRRRLSENSSNSNKPPSSDSPGDRAARPKDTPSGRSREGVR